MGTRPDGSKTTSCHHGSSVYNLAVATQVLSTAHSLAQLACDRGDGVPYLLALTRNAALEAIPLTKTESSHVFVPLNGTTCRWCAALRTVTLCMCLARCAWRHLIAIVMSGQGSTKRLSLARHIRLT
jgi:hypothetical protein